MNDHTIPRIQLRLSDYPYLLAAVLHAGTMEPGKNPIMLAQKAHRLINKTSYSVRQLNSTALLAWGLRVKEALDDDPKWAKSDGNLINSLCMGDRESPFVKVLIEALEEQHAWYGELYDFLAHVRSDDE